MSAPGESVSANFGFKVPVALGLSVLTLWTLFGNSLVIISLFKFKSLRSVPNLLIGNLALSDFLLALTILPLSSINNVLGHWIFGMAICNVWLSLDVLYCTASIWSLVVIAFDRFTATVFPIWYREQRKIKRFGCYSLFIWILSGLICLPPLIGWDGNRFIDPITKFQSALVAINNTSGIYQCDLFKEKNYVIYSATGSFILPLVVMVILYSRILFVLQRRARILRQNQKKRLSVGRAVTSLKSKQQQNDAEQQQHDAEQHQHDAEQQQLNNGGTTACCTTSLTVSNVSQTDASPRAAKRSNEDRSDEADEDDVTTAQQHSSSPNHHHPAEEDLKRKRRSVQQLFHTRKSRTASLKQIQRADQREQRATQRMLIIIVIFIVCWMPFTMMYLIRGLTSSSPEKVDESDGSAVSKALEIVQELSIWLGYANSGLNPILYTIFNKDFRLAFKKLLSQPCSSGRP